MKMPEHIDSMMLAPCGMNCMVCYKHLARKVPCPGCLSQDNAKPGHCLQCAIKECALQKSHTHCFRCGEYPCKSIKRLDKSYTSKYGVSLIENGCYIKENGADSFFSAQQKQFCCPACGGVISLHDSECSECGLPSKR